MAIAESNTTGHVVRAATRAAEGFIVLNKDGEPEDNAFVIDTGTGRYAKYRCAENGVLLSSPDPLDEFIVDKCEGGRLVWKSTLVEVTDDEIAVAMKA